MVSFEAHRKAVEEKLGHVRAVDVTADMVNRVRQEWLGGKDPRAPATTDRYLEALRAAYRLAVKQKRIGADRVPYLELMRPQNRRTGFVEDEMFWKLYRALPAAEADIALFAYRSGWRRGEAEGLTWDQVDAGAREVRLWDSKNGRGRVLPLEGELWTVVQRRIAARTLQTTAIFHRGGKPLGDWRKVWRKACKAAEAPGLLFHDLRRSAVRNLTRRGVPAVVAMQITGHRTRSVFDRYDIPTTDEARDALRKCFGGENSYGTATV